MEDHLFLRPSPTGQSPAHMCMKRSVPPCAEAVYADLVKPKEEAVIADVCCYAREKLNLDMVCVSHGPKDALARRKGGIGFASLQLLQGSFIIVVQRVV